METTSLRLGESPQEDRLAFLALPAKRASEQVTGSANDIFKASQAIISQIIADTCTKRTAEDFKRAREAQLQSYMMVMVAVSGFISAIVPSKVIKRLSWESLCELEADFNAKGVNTFGKDICDQALFTIWTLRKINDIASQIRESKAVQDTVQKADPKLARDFVFHILYSGFHLDCLKASLRAENPIYPEALECISDGLRSLVNAYAYIRQASASGSHEKNEPLILIDFDDEERDLLALSMKDVAADAIL